VNEQPRTLAQLTEIIRFSCGDTRSGRGGRRFKSCHSDQHLAEIPVSSANRSANTWRDEGRTWSDSSVLTFDFRPLALRARDYTAKALQALVGTLDDPAATPAAKVSAAIALLDRGWGKPTEHHEHVNLNAVADQHVEQR